MAKKKTHKTDTGSKRDKNKMTISSEQLRKFERDAERKARIERGYDEAFKGGGAHGGTVEAQVRRKRQSDKKELNKYRNQGTRNLDD